MCQISRPSTRKKENIYWAFGLIVRLPYCVLCNDFPGRTPFHDIGTVLIRNGDSLIHCYVFYVSVP